MSTTYNNAKREYISPLVEQIRLDMEISLALESEPPIGPNEGFLQAPTYFNSDPFKNNMG